MASGIGHLLREARHRKGITLSDAAARTGVRETHLLAIERDELEAIGVEPAYVRGILRVYAEYLGLDTSTVLARYGTPATVADGPGQDTAAPRSRRPGRRQVGAVVGAVLMLATLAGATVAVLVLRGGSPERQADADGQTATSAVTVSEEASAAASSSASGAASESASEDATALDIRPGPTPEGLTMKLEFTDTVWIRVLVDGENKLEGIMQPGAVTQFTGEDKIELRIGVAEAVSFSLNGAWYGNIASDLEGPVDVTCTPETSCRVTGQG